MIQLYRRSVGKGLIGFLFGIPAFRLRQIFVDTVNTGHSGLDGLDLHADALQRSKDLRDISDNGDRGTYGHAEKGLDRGIACRGEQHNGSDDESVQNQNDRGIQRVIKIGPIYGSVAVFNVLIVFLPHVVLNTEGVNHTDAADRLRYMVADAADGCPVLKLRGQHPFLEQMGHRIERREQEQQENGQTTVLDEEDRKDTDDFAGIRKHTDDSGGEQGFNGIYIAYKTGRGWGTLRKEGAPRWLLYLN